MKNIEISGESDQYYNFLCMDIFRNFPHKQNKYNQVKVTRLGLSVKTGVPKLIIIIVPKY